MPVADRSDRATLQSVTGLDILRRHLTTERPPLPEMQRKVLLDALGLGLEQTCRYLANERPDREAFHAWIVATAGPPDPLRLARYEAVIRDVPPPAATERQLAAVDAAPDVLGPDDLAVWEENGTVVLRQAITPDEAAAVAALLWHDIGADPDDPDSWYAAQGLQGLWLPRFQHPVMESARRSARVHKAFAQLWGTVDLWMTIDRLSFNPPERMDRPFQGSPLHWDVSLARPIPFATQAILYLTDTAADQGALRVVPGFHRRIDAWLDELGDVDPRSVDLAAEAVTIPAGAGDLVIWRQDLPHGASPNTAAQPRLAQYVNMYPAWLDHRDEWI